MAFIPVYYVSTFPQSWKLAPNQIRRMDSLATSQNNYDLSIESTTNGRNGETCTIFELISSAAINITGIVAPTAGTGTTILLYNAGASTITLKNASGSSSTANQMNVTAAADYSLTAGAWAVLHYDAVSKWTVGTEVPSTVFKIEVPGASEGVITFFDCAWWSAHNTGYYDAAGTKTANAVDVYYRHGSTVPTQNYASSTAAEQASIPLASGLDELIQIKRNNPKLYWIATQSNGVTVRYRKNEQGGGLNRQ